MSDPEHGAVLTDGPPRWLLVAGIAVATAAVVAVLVFAAVDRRSSQPPLVIPAVPAPQASSQECQTVLAALPQQLGDYRRATPADPVPPATAAWQGRSGDPVILRCGLDRPTDFVVGAPIQVVDSVQWFEARGPDNSRTTWFTVDRPVYIALSLPQGSGPTPIQQLSDVVSAKLPAVSIRPGPPPG